MRIKVRILLLFILVAFLCVGCDIATANVTRDIRHSGFSLSNSEFECSYLLPSDNGYLKTRFLSTTYSITMEGDVYLLSFSRKFSNDMHCMKANFQHKVTAIFDGKVIKADDGRMYYLVQTGENAAFSLVPSNDSNYLVYKVILDDSEVIKAVTVDQNIGSYYVLKKDGNVYNYVISKNNNSATIISSPVVYRKSVYGEDIIDFNYAGKSTATFVRTNTQIFRMLPTNKEECSKYVDIPCSYEMQLDNGLTEHHDKILGFSGSFLITTYGKQFNASNV